ncbi:MAG: flotillin family protein [Planctomycetota bacterium]|nr:flotillin family protein [Planctomycetota bacterium]MEE3231411.1 flotillin family protein [Planctomycetota bacterium]
MEPMIATVVFLLVAVGAGALFATHYKKCPSDKILVIYGKTTGGRFSRCIHGGSAFVWPLIQDYQFLDLTPISIDIKLEGISTLEDIQLDLSSIFTVGVSPEPGVKENAAERLLGLTLNDIQHIAEDIIRTHMPPVIATMTFEELNAATDKQTREIDRRLYQAHGVAAHLTGVGVRLINFIISDVSVSPGQDPNVGKAVESPPPFPRETGLGTEETETPANEL